MNTPAHLIFASAAFASPENRKVTLAALAGGFLPDASLYGMALWSRFISGNSFEYIFDVQYFSEAWHNVFRIDNSFILWGIVLVIGLWLKRTWIVAFTGGALLHLVLDFPLHHNDGRAHFWPITNWKFDSPVSYWHPGHYGNIVGPIEIALVVLATIYLWRKFKGNNFRYLFAGIAALQIVPSIMFSLMFN